MNATAAILTPPLATGAIGIIEVAAASERDLDQCLQTILAGPLKSGSAAVKDLIGIDRGVVARWSGTSCYLMPHGGAGVVRRLMGRLRDLGVREAGESTVFPEAGMQIEHHMLRALASATSPLAIDLLLEQPDRWHSGMPSDDDLDRVLNRLLAPPLVVALGPANIGKSTLVNALAGRSVSIVADAPGTTRDHVGVMLDVGGLTIRYLDTPGLRQAVDTIEAEARSLSLVAAELADLVLLMGDAGAAPPQVPPRFLGESRRIALRSDLGHAAWDADVRLCARTGENLSNLVALVRDTLVPPIALRDPRPWKFWKGPAAATTTTTGQV